MRLSLSVCALAWVVLPAYAQQSTPAPTAPVTPPVGQGVNGDWAYVERYRADNQSLIAISAPKRVVFMGDSITQGWAAEAFIKDNPNFVGRGISGQTAPQMLVRFRSDVIALKPAVVHIMAGTNDVAQNTGPETTAETEGYIKSMVDLALANKIKVVLASIPPANEFYWHPGLSPVPQIRALNAWLKEYAASRRLTYIDYWSVLATPEGAMKPEYSADGVHPNAAGYEAMRPLAKAAIESASRRH